MECISSLPKPLKYPKELFSISDHIRKRRLDLKLSQLAVARIIGVTEDTITFWENDRAEPRISIIPALLRFLGYNPYPIDASTFGGKIKEFRYFNGLSKKRLASMLNVDASTITTWEENEFIPSASNYEKVMLFLSCNTYNPTQHQVLAM